ncbi:hypothetical protein HanRHA438_Chr10g0450461 [Helianthus annuus]|nr:hypothetical protein HanRHA438_Chr10g0450461 [Helianthus annuus]
MALQEIQMSGMPELFVSQFWGRAAHRSVIVDLRGNSGGLVSCWDTNVFNLDSIIEDQFLILHWGLRDSGFGRG